MRDEVLNIFQAHLELSEPVIGDMRLEKIGVTSFGFIELVLKIEAKTGLEFEDKFLNYIEFQTVDQVIAYCQSLNGDD